MDIMIDKFLIIAVFLAILLSCAFLYASAELSSSRFYIYVSESRDTRGSSFFNLTGYRDDDNWRPHLMFRAYKNPFSEGQQFCVGRDADSYVSRYTHDILMSAANCDNQGLTHQFMFIVSNVTSTEVQPITILKAVDPYRNRLEFGKVTKPGWDVQGVFYVDYSLSRPIKYYVSETAVTPKRAYVNKGTYFISADYKPYIMISGYEKRFLGSVPVCVGRYKDRDMIFSRENCTMTGWTTIHKFYAFTSQYTEVGAIQQVTAVMHTSPYPRARLTFETTFGEWKKRFHFWVNDWLSTPIRYYVSGRDMHGPIQISLGKFGTKLLPKLMFEVYEKQFPGSVVLCAGRRSYSDIFLLEDSCEKGEYKQLNKAYVYQSAVRGGRALTLMARTDPLACQLEFGENVWIPSWPFAGNFWVTGYHEAPVQIFVSVDRVLGDKCIVNFGSYTSNSVWKPKLDFEAYVNPFPGSIELCIGRAYNRDLVDMRNNCEGSGWNHIGVFSVYRQAVLGTKPISLLLHKNEYRSFLEYGDNIFLTLGWSNHLVFWVIS